MDSRFDGSNYTFWKIIMEVYLKTLGMDIWKLVEEGYEFPKVIDESEENGEISTSKTMNVDPENIKQYEWNA